MSIVKSKHIWERCRSAEHGTNRSGEECDETKITLESPDRNRSPYKESSHRSPHKES